MPGLVGQQDLWITGSRFLVIRDDDTNGALLDLGTVQTASPTQQIETVELLDGDGGALQRIDQAVVRATESYEIVHHNFAPDNLALLFLSNPPAAYTQPSGATIASVSHKAVVGAGKYVKIKDNDGQFVYNLATITVKDNTEVTTYVAGTDYEVSSLARGFIQILSGGSINDGDTLKITYTLNASSGKVLINPLSSAQAIKCHGFLIWGRNSNSRQSVREFDCQISPAAANFQVQEYSQYTLRVDITSDILNVTAPAGRLLQFLGTPPTDP